MSRGSSAAARSFLTMSGTVRAARLALTADRDHGLAHPAPGAERGGASRAVGGELACPARLRRSSSALSAHSAGAGYSLHQGPGHSRADPRASRTSFR